MMTSAGAGRVAAARHSQDTNRQHFKELGKHRVAHQRHHQHLGELVGDRDGPEDPGRGLGAGNQLRRRESVLLVGALGAATGRRLGARLAVSKKADKLAIR